jgi:hypothetical protein
MANEVQVYRYTDVGAGNLTGQASSLINLLKTCLVDGYATASVTSITAVGTAATATLAAANATLVPGDYLTFSGATGGDASIYNAKYRIEDMEGAEVYFTLSSAPSGAATGTLLYQKSPAGWTNPYNDTNIGVFLSSATNNSPMYMRVDETGASAGGQKEANIRGYETMSDANTGTGPFPTVAQWATGACWRKSNTTDATARAWTIVADDRGCYVQMNWGSSTSTWSLQYFGRYPSRKASDAYNCLCTTNSAYNQTIPYDTIGNKYNDFTAISYLYPGYSPRSYSQSGGSVPIYSMNLSGATGYVISQWTSGLAGGVANINGPDNAVIFLPTLLTENSNVRGQLPGCYQKLGYFTYPNNWDLYDNIAELPGRKLMLLYCMSYVAGGFMFVDVTGPWD